MQRSRSTGRRDWRQTDFFKSKIVMMPSYNVADLVGMTCSFISHFFKAQQPPTVQAHRSRGQCEVPFAFTIKPPTQTCPPAEEVRCSRGRRSPVSEVMEINEEMRTGSGGNFVRCLGGVCGEVADVDSVKGLKERPESKLIAPSFVHDFLTSSSFLFLLFNQ